MRVQKKNRKVQVQEEKKLSVEQPDLLGKNDNGTEKIEKRNWYTMLGADGIGRLTYFPLENKYSAGEGNEIPKEIFEQQYLPFLSWDFDELETEKIMEDAKDEKGKKIKVDSGKRRIINKFPPTPENIIKKREELFKEAMLNGAAVETDDLYRATLPRALRSGNVFIEK